MRNSFIVKSKAARGALYAGMTIFGGATIPAVQLPGRDRLRPYNAGTHPWTTAGSNSTLFNHSSSPLEFGVLVSAGGVVWKQQYTLAALETKALDIGGLIATGAKDRNGQVLPKTVTSGVVTWYTLAFGKGTGRYMVVRGGSSTRSTPAKPTARLCSPATIRWCTGRFLGRRNEPE